MHIYHSHYSPGSRTTPHAPPGVLSEIYIFGCFGIYWNILDMFPLQEFFCIMVANHIFISTLHTFWFFFKIRLYIILLFDRHRYLPNITKWHFTWLYMELQFKWCLFHKNWSITCDIGGFWSWNKGLNLGRIWVDNKIWPS